MISLLAAIVMTQAGLPSLDVLTTMPTGEAASLLLASPPAALESHRIVTNTFREFQGVRFASKPEAADEDLCVRRTYMVSASDIARIRAGGHRTAAIARYQIALARTCIGLDSDDFAWVQGHGATIETAGETLRWLADLRQRARRDEPLQATITCLTSSFMPDPCRAGAHAVIAGLPLESTYIIERGRAPGGWELSVMPTGPGQLFYRVALGRDDGGRPTVTIRWEAPAPF